MTRGRQPRVPGATSLALVGVRMTPAEQQALETVAAELRVPVSELIRESVNEYVADYRERLVFVVRNSGRGVP